MGTERDTSDGRIRVAFLQKAPSGHNIACLQALIDDGRFDLRYTVPGLQTNAPYSQVEPRGATRLRHSRFDGPDEVLLAELEAFAPHLLMAVGWEVPSYRACARAFRGRALRVVCMDNQWQWKPRKILGVVSSPVYLRPYFDAAFLPGERQRRFARLLGFKEQRIFEGFYSCDSKVFGAVEPAADRRRFVFVGRLVEDKAIDVLADAYNRYRAGARDPWPLVVCGEGPLAPLLERIEGVEILGFLQPDQLVSQFERSAFLVLPSRFEPWGVVVHEAATAGLGVIASTAVGAADMMVAEGENGSVVRAGDAGELALALRWAHGLDDDGIERASATSRRLAAARTPDAWPRALAQMAELAPRPRRGPTNQR